VAGFAVSADPADAKPASQDVPNGRPRLRDETPGLRIFRDHDLALSRLYGAIRPVAASAKGGSRPAYAPFALLLDPSLRVLASAPVSELGALVAALRKLPPPGQLDGAKRPAPVLVLPRLLEPEFCRHLIGIYEAAGGGGESGFMRDVGGRTVGVQDPTHKRRRDLHIEDEVVREALRQRILRRLVPEIEKAFQYRATRIERYIVACYDAAEGGHFRAHRDNTTRGTAHRRFAVSINLNDDFDGGELWFPEFSPRRYRPPAGGAVVFSSSLLHEATRVTRGLRYATLPFLYDEEAARVRERNQAFLGEASDGAEGGATPLSEPMSELIPALHAHDQALTSAAAEAR
jgi:predicted 2-oxoglutarate/Fe(II)-dependent dioxygenase YbiX